MSMSLKSFVKCSECSTLCHASCQLAIPEYCCLPAGMIQALRDVEVLKKEKELKKEQQKLNLSQDQNSESKDSLDSTHSTLDKQAAVRQQRPPQNFANSPILNSRSKVENADVQLLPFRKGSSLDDFHLVAVLGKGNFGKVMLAQEKNTKIYYAIKILKKDFILEHDEVESTRAEKRCFQVATRTMHPFLVNLHSCFQTESRLYFVMQVVSGGDLMWHIQRGRFTFKQAKFYACEVLLALEYWHQNNIVYRFIR